MVSALDFRFGWSSVPAAVSVVGDVLVGVGLLIAMITTIQNGYAAANIKVEAGPEGRVDGRVLPLSATRCTSAMS